MLPVLSCSINTLAGISPDPVPGGKPLANTLLLNIKNKMRILIKNNNFV